MSRMRSLVRTASRPSEGRRRRPRSAPRDRGRVARGSSSIESRAPGGSRRDRRQSESGHLTEDRPTAPRCEQRELTLTESPGCGTLRLNSRSDAKDCILEARGEGAQRCLGTTPPGRPAAVAGWSTRFFLGLYLTFRGYHSFDGDQAYRLPLLLHQQDPQLYAADPFVRAFDAFNPHRGWLLVLDLVTRPLGPAAGLFLIFVLTFGATCVGIDRLARGVWPTLGHGAGLVAIGLVLAAKAGNIGTNHIFEAMVLDRQVAFALGWLALAQLVVQPDRGRLLVMAAVGAATLVHPSAGLQLALVLAASWTAWCLLGRWTEVSIASRLCRDLGPGGRRRSRAGGQPRVRTGIAG